VINRSNATIDFKIASFATPKLHPGTPMSRRSGRGI
jgi:hypothetical protein